MTTPPVPNPLKPLKHVRASDLRGAAQLAVKATARITDVVEGVHQSVLGSMGMVSAGDRGKTDGLTGMVYKSIQGVTQLVGKGLDKALEKLIPLLEADAASLADSANRDAAISALNGVMGDRLVDDGNPLAIGMQLRMQSATGEQMLAWDAPPALAQATDRIMLFAHGLCMTDSQWLGASADGAEVDLTQDVARCLGYTPVFVRYNTGLHVSLNGRELSRQLELLVQHWPVALKEISIVAHSMGGLVSRSAVQVAPQNQATWPTLLKNLVFLGTPHHGAPLERAGNWLDVILGSTPYTAPYAKLAQLRSAGITDLRYGHVADADWVGKDRFRKSPDTRELVPLPEGVACYAVAATTSASRGALADHLIGDGLVPLNSALGHHQDLRHRLVFAKESQWIAYETGHIALMKSPAVAAQLLRWLA